MTVGQDSTGFAFDLQLETEHSQTNMASIMSAFDRHDPITAFLWPTSDIPIANFNATVVYNPKRTTAKFARFTYTYGK